MTNILLTSPEGPESTGLTILREAAANAYPTARFTVLAPRRPQLLGSFSSEEGYQERNVTQTEASTYLLDNTPRDLVARAFLQREAFSQQPWDGILVGVSSQSCLGLDALTQACACAAVTASLHYLCYAATFCQERRPEEDPQARGTFRNAEKTAAHFLRATPFERGRCYLVNFPHSGRPQKGYKETQTAHYSPTSLPPTDLVPRAREEQSDVTALRAGFTTICSLNLRMNPHLRY